MVWWKRLLGKEAKSPIAEMLYRSERTLYSLDGKRAADIMEFANGKIYIRESELAEGADFQDRHSGNVVGPFASPDDAERFIVATSWFKGEAN